MQIRNTADRFGLIAKLFHWTAAAAFVGSYIFVYYALWVLHDTTNPAFVPTLNYHWILGILIGVLVVPRLVWRLSGPLPDEIAGSPLEHSLAKLAHLGLYAIMVLMPITGYIGTRRHTDFFLFQVASFQDTALFAWIAESWDISWVEFEKPVDAVHHFVGKWVASTLILLHVAAAFFHHWVRRDNTLRRMIFRASP